MGNPPGVVPAMTAGFDWKLADFTKRYGIPPNFVRFVSGGQPFGAAGMPAMQYFRGDKTPELSEMAAEV